MMQYIPVQEDFVIQMEKQYCALESVVGPFQFVISGNINSWEPSSGAMDFQFTAVDIKLFGNKVGAVSNGRFWCMCTHLWAYSSQCGAV
jgi:hypothetical protein